MEGIKSLREEASAEAAGHTEDASEKLCRRLQVPHEDTDYCSFDSSLGLETVSTDFSNNVPARGVTSLTVPGHRRHLVAAVERTTWTLCIFM